MPEIPSPSRGPRPNIVTAAVVLLAILLAVVWLGSGGDAAPPVPAGLPVAAPASVPAAPAEPRAAAGAPPRSAAEEPGVRAAKPRRARRARRDARPHPVPARGRAGRTRHDSPATSRAAASAPAAGPASAPDPEFAIG